MHSAAAHLEISSTYYQGSSGQQSRQHFAAKLRADMHRLGLKQSALADLLEVSQGRVSDWLNVKAYPQPRTLKALNAALAKLTSECA